MNEEEIEWYEENWHKGKSLKKSTSDSREFKSVHVSWWVDWDKYDSTYWQDRHCWKSKRKTHYKVPKVKKEKKRKAKEKEHWRYKENYSYRGRYWFDRKDWEVKLASKRREQERKKAHIEELQKTGQWIYRWKYESWYDRHTEKYHSAKLDLNNPFDVKRYNAIARRFFSSRSLTY